MDHELTQAWKAWCLKQEVICMRQQNVKEDHLQKELSQLLDSSITVAYLVYAFQESLSVWTPEPTPYTASLPLAVINQALEKYHLYCIQTDSKHRLLLIMRPPYVDESRGSFSAAFFEAGRSGRRFTSF